MHVDISSDIEFFLWRYATLLGIKKQCHSLPTGQKRRYQCDHSLVSCCQVLQDVSNSWLSLNSTVASVLEGSFSNATRTIETVAVQNLEVYNHLEQMSTMYVPYP